MNRKQLRALAGISITGAIMVAGALPAAAHTNSVAPTTGDAASVDGDVTEWGDTSGLGGPFLIGDMHLAGSPDKVVLATLHGVVSDGVLYLYAEGENNWTVAGNSEVWVAFNENSNKVSLASFAEVVDVDGNVVGWEASVVIPEDATSINVHTNWGDGDTGALAQGNDLVPFEVTPPAEEPPSEEPPGEEPPAEVCVDYSGPELAAAMIAGGSTVTGGEATLLGIPADACEFTLNFTTFDLPDDTNIGHTSATVDADDNGSTWELDLAECGWESVLYTGDELESAPSVSGLTLTGLIAGDIELPEDCEEPPAEEPPAEEPPAEDPPAEDPPAEEPPAEEPPAEDPPAEDPPAEDPPAQDPPADEDDETVVDDASGEIDTDDTTETDTEVDDTTEEVIESNDTAVLDVKITASPDPQDDEQLAAAPQVQADQLAATGIDSGTLAWLAFLAGLSGAGLVTATRRFELS